MLPHEQSALSHLKEIIHTPKRETKPGFLDEPAVAQISDFWHKADIDVWANVAFDTESRHYPIVGYGIKAHFDPMRPL
jgi:hypothetical protein